MTNENNILNDWSDPKSDSKPEWVISSTRTNLTIWLNLWDFINEYEWLSPTIVKLAEINDNREYKSKDILSKILEIIKEKWLGKFKVISKKLDDKWNIICIDLKWNDPQIPHWDYPNLSFLRDCIVEWWDSANITHIMLWFEDSNWIPTPQSEIVYEYEK